MKPRFVPFLLAAFLAGPFPATAQETAQKEVISASCMLAFGRPALGGELIDPIHANKSLSELVNLHREDLKNDPELQRLVDNRAQRDVFGYKHERVPGMGPRPQGFTYTEQISRHIGWLAQHPDLYRDVVDRAYRLVIGRAAYPEEFEYWKPHGTLPFVLLVAAIENWAQRNQPGLMVTTGMPSISVNSRFLVTLRLSPAVANEARTLLGLPGWTDVARRRNPGHHVVAVGAADIESVGGVHFALTGDGPLWATAN